MLRSLICHDIKEDEELIEGEKEAPTFCNVEYGKQQEDDEQTGLSASTHGRENKTMFLEAAREKLRCLKSMQNSSHQIKANNRNVVKPTDFCRRKRKIDIGKPSTSEAQDVLTNTVPKPSEPVKEDASKVVESPNLSIREMVTKFGKRKAVKFTNSIVLQHLTEQDFKVQEVHDPHGIKKSRIEKDLDEAIKQKDYELAQKISDEISERQLSERIVNNFNACNYLEEKKFEEEAKNNRKKKLKWMFDNKERWELKGNM